MDSNEYNIVELNARLGKIKVSRNLRLLSVGALTLVGTSNFVMMSSSSMEESIIESSLFFMSAFAFGIGAIKKNIEVKKLQKQINKLQHK